MAKDEKQKKKIKQGQEYIYERKYNPIKGYYLEVVGVRDMYAEIQEASVGVSLQDLFSRYGGELLSKEPAWTSGDVSDYFTNLFELMDLADDVKARVTDLKAEIKRELKKNGTVDPKNGTVDPKNGTVDPKNGTVDPKNGTVKGDEKNEKK